MAVEIMALRAVATIRKEAMRAGSMTPGRSSTTMTQLTVNICRKVHVLPIKWG